MDQKVIRSEGLGVARKILKIGKEHGEESRLYAQRQRNAGLDELADHIERNKGGKRFQRCSQQRSRGLEPCYLLYIRGWMRGCIKIQTFDCLQLPLHVFDRLR